MFISEYLPKSVLDNDQLAKLYPNWPAEKIFDKTGISRRHIADRNETAADMAAAAAERLFAASGTKPDEIDFLILTTQSPDYPLPTSACLLQDRLGIPTRSGAFDINLGCSAYVYGLAVAKGLLLAGMSRRLLLIASETYSKYIHPMDKSVRTLFGDGAAATLLTHDDALRIGSFVFGTDGSGGDNLIVPVGGSRRPDHGGDGIETTDASGNTRTEKNLFMDGPKIFHFTADAVPAAVAEVLHRNQLSLDQIDLIVFHQANKFILDYLAATLKLPAEKFYIHFDDCGNTVSASIPIALARAASEGRLADGNRVLIAGFGVGLSWGAGILTWSTDGLSSSAKSKHSD